MTFPAELFFGSSLWFMMQGHVYFAGGMLQHIDHIFSGHKSPQVFAPLSIASAVRPRWKTMGDPSLCVYVHISENTHTDVCDISTSLQGFQELCLNWYHNHTSKMEEKPLNRNGSKNRTRSGDADLGAFFFPKGRQRGTWSCLIPSPWVCSLAVWALTCAHVQG